MCALAGYTLADFDLWVAALLPIFRFALDGGWPGLDGFGMTNGKPRCHRCGRAFSPRRLLWTLCPAGLPSWMDAMAVRGNPHRACSAEWTQMVRVAARSGLASLDGPGADRSKSTSCGPQQWRVNPDREHGRVDRVD